MSASSKKKLRKELNAAALTEKQRAERKEARKLKAYSISFIAIMLAVVLTFVSVLAYTGIKNSGILEKNTIAAIVNGKQLNTVEFNYFFRDAISSTYSQWYEQYGDSTSSIVSWMLNLDLKKPLDQQAHSDGGTWADRFLQTALKDAKETYKLASLAEQAGHKLTEDEQSELDNSLYYTTMYASLYGYKNADEYLKVLYGPGSDEESFKAYMTLKALATSYYTAKADTFEYEDSDLRGYEEGKYDNYSSFTYSWYYVNYQSYLPKDEPEKSEDGTTTPTSTTKKEYTDEEIAAAKEQAKADAEALAKVLDLEEFQKAVADLPVNESSTTAKVTTSTSVLYPTIPEVYAKWLAEEGREENNITFIADETTSTDDNGIETSNPNGNYYVVMFQSRNDNLRLLANVRHLLVAFEGEKDKDGNYTQAQKDAAKAEAEKLLKEWQDGAATEDSFAALVKEKTDDSGSKSTGGLYEDISAGSNYVENFRNWAIDDTRKAGDTGIVDTEYGYHIMYYVGDGDISYRDAMITNDMLAEDMQEWFKEIMEDVSAELKNTSRVDTSVSMT